LIKIAWNIGNENLKSSTNIDMFYSIIENLLIQTVCLLTFSLRIIIHPFVSLLLPDNSIFGKHKPVITLQPKHLPIMRLSPLYAL